MVVPGARAAAVAAAERRAVQRRVDARVRVRRARAGRRRRAPAPGRAAARPRSSGTRLEAGELLVGHADGGAQVEHADASPSSETTTFWKPSASRTPAQTASSISSIVRRSASEAVRREQVVDGRRAGARRPPPAGRARARARRAGTCRPAGRAARRRAAGRRPARRPTGCRASRRRSSAAARTARPRDASRRGPAGADLRDVGRQPVLAPVEVAVLDQVRAAALEALVQQRGPVVRRRGLAEQRVARLVAALDDHGVEVVPRRAVQVDDRRAEAEAGRSGACDGAQHGLEVIAGRGIHGWLSARPP